MNGMSVEPVRHRITSDEFEAMSGVFRREQRLELLEGELIEMTPIGPAHAAAVKHLNQLLVPAVGDTAVVSVQDPIRLSDLSEPQPDLALLRPRSDFYATAHPAPTDVLLVIEVSDTTASFDRNIKRPLYAAAGIPELWILDLPERLVEIATVPAENTYGRIRQFTTGTITPSVFPEISVSVGDLFG
jgi:Uma2 family endonuclease